MYSYSYTYTSYIYVKRGPETGAPHCAPPPDAAAQRLRARRGGDEARMYDIIMYVSMCVYIYIYICLYTTTTTTTTTTTITNYY